MTNVYTLKWIIQQGGLVDADIVQLNIYTLKAMMTSFIVMTRKYQAVDLKPRIEVHTVSYATCIKYRTVKAGFNVCYYVQHVSTFVSLRETNGDNGGSSSTA